MGGRGLIFLCGTVVGERGCGACLESLAGAALRKEATQAGMVLLGAFVMIELKPVQQQFVFCYFGEQAAADVLAAAAGGQTYAG